MCVHMGYSPNKENCRFIFNTETHVMYFVSLLDTNEQTRAVPDIPIFLKITQYLFHFTFLSPFVPRQIKIIYFFKKQKYVIYQNGIITYILY